MWFFLAKGNSQAKIWKSLQNSFFFKNENDLQWIQFSRRLFPMEQKKIISMVFHQPEIYKGICRSKKRGKSPPQHHPKSHQGLHRVTLRKDGEIVSWWSKYSYCRMIICISVSPYEKLLLLLQRCLRMDERFWKSRKGADYVKKSSKQQ